MEKNSFQTIIKHKLRKPYKWENFTIGKIIGKGTYSTCYSCVESEENRVFAVKVIKFNGSKAQETQINNEIDLLEGLSKHPLEKHLFPTFYGYAFYKTPSNEHFYALVFEEAEGDLKKYVEDKGKLNYNQNLQLLGSLGACLKFFAEHKIIHGDLKPENVLYFINKDQEIEFKITDLGEGKKLNGTSKISVRGTARYFAPEMNYAYLNRKKTVQARKIDVYSAGLTMLWANLRGLEFFENNKDQNLREREKDCNPFEIVEGPYDRKLKRAIKETLERFPQISNEEKKTLRKILKHSLEYNQPKRYDSQKLQNKIQNLLELSNSKQDTEEISRSVAYSENSKISL